MKKIVLVILVFSLMACTLLGNQLGKIFDKKTDENKYETKYAKEGAKADIEILKALFTKK